MPPEEPGLDRPPPPPPPPQSLLKYAFPHPEGLGARALGGLSSPRLLDKLSEEARSRCRSPSESDRDILDELS